MKVLFTFLLSLGFISLAHADVASTCDASRYSKALPIKGVRFGMSIEEAKKAIGNQLGNDVSVRSDRIKAHNTGPFDEVDIGFFEGKLTTFTFSYSNSWQDRFGGIAEAVQAVADKFKGDFGFGGPRQENNGIHSVTWEEDKGATLTLIVKLPRTLGYAYRCDALTIELKKKLADSANFGF